MSYFGTDGIRGKFGELPITPDFILKLGYVTGLVLIENNNNPARKPSVVIGKDTRLSGYVIEGALQAGFNAAGVDVHMLGPLPTPAIAHLTRSFNADAGVVISASHNPYFDNGIKFFSADGKKLTDEMQSAINDKLTAIMDASNSDNSAIMPILDPARLGKNNRINDAKGRYIEFCKSTFPGHLDSRGLKLVVDTANGAGYHVAPKVFHELGAHVVAIGAEPNGYNINEKVGATHPKALQAAVLQNEADYGIALDGDGDRLMMVDKHGKVYDGDSLIYVIAKARAKEGVAIGGVVGTVMTNMAMELALQEQGVAFCRAKVGDRYVLEQLHQRGWLIGGEASGHILCMDKHNTGDGIISALQVLAALRTLKQDLATVCADWQPYPQTMINVRIQKGQDWQSVSKEALAAVEKELEGKGRVVLRASGTEPVVRVMVEARQADWAQQGAERIAAAITGTAK